MGSIVFEMIRRANGEIVIFSCIRVSELFISQMVELEVFSQIYRHESHRVVQTLTNGHMAGLALNTIRFFNR